MDYFISERVKKCEAICKNNKRCKNYYQFLSHDCNLKVCTLHYKKCYKLFNEKEQAAAIPVNYDIQENIRKHLEALNYRDYIISHYLNENRILIPQIGHHIKNMLWDTPLGKNFYYKLWNYIEHFENELCVLSRNLHIDDIFEYITNHHKKYCSFCDDDIFDLKRKVGA